MPIKVMKLNTGNVNRFNNLKQDKPVVVAYLMKGCHWCDQMKPEWDNMKRSINGDGVLAEVTVVNGDRRVIDRMNVDTQHLNKGFPSVCRYTPGKRTGQSFKGERTADNLREFSKKVLKFKEIKARRSRGKSRRRRRRKNKTKRLIDRIKQKYRKTRRRRRKSKSFYKKIRKRLGFK